MPFRAFDDSDRKFLHPNSLEQLDNGLNALSGIGGFGQKNEHGRDRE